MVSDPDQQANSQSSGPSASATEAASAFAGFSTAAATPVPDESAAETATSKSWARQFKDSCDKLWDQMKDRLQKRSTSFATTDPQVDDIYKKFWFRSHLGQQVFDCGHCISMAATKDKPLTRAQIEQMVLSGINRKDPPWETIYMWNHKGQPDPARGQMVQQVINDMRQAGKIPADHPIHVSTSYPCAHMKDFNKHLRSLFAQASDPNGTQTPKARAGIHAHERAGLHAV